MCLRLNCSNRDNRVKVIMFGGIGFIMVLIAIIAVLVVSMTTGEFIDGDPEIAIPQLGTLRGSISKTAWTDQKIYQFRGIHYAEAPSGRRRFKPPVPRLPWTGVKDARKDGIACPQLAILQNLTPDQLTERDWEDCLHLSVYTKDFTSNSPVMFYIHGGSFVIGGAYEHPPGYLLENDVVLVVVQYRLGALGFLSTKTEAIPGNAGVLDIILGLEWVQKNIRRFGGDPDRVTIFGQSAGGGLVSALTLSPVVREGLFHRAIVQSGAMFSHWGFESKPIEKAQNIAWSAGCSPAKTLEEINEFFMGLSLMKLLEITATQGFKMSVGDLSGVLPDTPRNLLTRSAHRTYPVMAGITKHDGTFYLAGLYDLVGQQWENSRNSWEIIEGVAKLLVSMPDETGYTEILMQRMLFTHQQLENGNFTELIPGLVDMCNNVIIKSPTMRFAQLNAQRKPSETYFYSFEYRGKYTRFGYGKPTDHYPFNGGVHHSDDNIYIFPIFELTESDAVMARMMSQLWTSFAATGVPRADNVPSWPSMSKPTGPYLHIDKSCFVDEDFLKELTATVDDKTNSILRPLYNKSSP